MQCPRTLITSSSSGVVQVCRVRVLVVFLEMSGKSVDYDAFFQIALALRDLARPNYFFLANRLLRRARTLETSNWTYSRSRSS